MLFCDVELPGESRSGDSLVNKRIIGTLIKKSRTGHRTAEIRRRIWPVRQLVIISDSQEGNGIL